MTVERSEQFKKSYRKLPRDIQERVKKALLLFAADPRHPSLENKKLEGTEHIWELRVTRGYRGYRMIYERIPGGIFLRRVGTHDILRSP